MEMKIMLKSAVTLFATLPWGWNALVEANDKESPGSFQLAQLGKPQGNAQNKQPVLQLPKLNNNNAGQGNQNQNQNLFNQNRNQQPPKGNQNPLNLGNQGNKGTNQQPKLNLPPVGQQNKGTNQQPQLNLPKIGQGQGQNQGNGNKGTTQQPQLNLPKIGQGQGQGNKGTNQQPLTLPKVGQGQGTNNPPLNLPKLGQGQVQGNQGAGQPGNVGTLPKVDLPKVGQGQGQGTKTPQLNLPKVGQGGTGAGQPGNVNSLPKVDLPKLGQGQGQGNKGVAPPGNLNTLPKVDLPKVGQGKVDPKNLGNNGLLNNPNLGKLNPNTKGIQLPKTGALSNNTLGNNVLKTHQPAFKVGNDLKLNNNFKDLKLGGVQKLPTGKQVRVSLPQNDFAAKLKSGDLNRLVNTKAAQQVNLQGQYNLKQKGDVSREMGLLDRMTQNGGWQNRCHGLISPAYTSQCASNFYCGPSCYPKWCWCPKWSPWVNWCWTYPVVALFDPRPTCCQPMSCDPCPTWEAWEYPTWNQMPEVACGTWVDVPEVVVNEGIDLQLLAVRFVDPGHVDEQYGPRYRAYFRNNTKIAVEQSFNVLAYASNDQTPGKGAEAGVRVKRMDPGEIQSVDIRLPFEANIMGRDEEGRKTPFKYLHLIVDSHRETAEMIEDNNGAVLDRGDILPVDPAVFAADPEGAPAGATMLVAGEGFGPEAGQVLVNVGGLELQGEILGWYDLGVQVRLPELALAADTNAEVVVIRGDTAASNPLTVTIKAAGSVSPATAMLSP